MCRQAYMCLRNYFIIDTPSTMRKLEHNPDQFFNILCRSSCDVLVLSFVPWFSDGLLTDCTSSAVHTVNRSNSAYPRTLKLCSVARRHSHRLVMENENRSPAEISSWGVTAWHVWGNLLYNEHAAVRFFVQLSSRSECEVDQRSAVSKGGKVFHWKVNLAWGQNLLQIRLYPNQIPMK